MDCFNTRKKCSGWRTALLGSALSLFLLPATSWALDLGNIQVSSTLEQPLEAHIDLLDVNDANFDHVRVNLADIAVFSRVGLERGAILEQLLFEIKTLEDGRVVVVVTTEQPLSEPYLNFLVDMDYGSGRTYREFTILLDPPVFQESAKASVDAPELVASRIVDEQAASVIEPPAVAAVSSEEEVVSAGVEPTVTSFAHYGPVKHNEALWNIAKSMRPDGVSVNQMMLALLKENPEAFFGNNVNMLKEGAILRLSSEQVVHAFTSKQAVLEIAAQNESWLEYVRERKAARAVVSESADVDLQGDKAAAAEGVATEAVQSPPKMLEIVAPEGDDASEAVASSEISSLQSQINELTDKVSFANDIIAAAEEEKGELGERLAALRDQMVAMQSLIALKDRELESLRGQSGEVGRDSASVLELQTLVERQSVDVDDIVVDKVAGPSVWKDPMVLATLAGVIFLLGLLIWLLTRSRERPQSIDEFKEQASQIELADDAISDLSEATPEPRQPAQATPFQAEQTQFVSDEPLTSIDGSVAPSEFQPEQSQLVTAEPLTQLDAATEIVMATDSTPSISGLDAGSDLPSEAVDAITEAELYTAFEKFDKAEEVLRSSLQGNPHDPKAKVKLLEVLALTRQTDVFEEEAEELYAVLGGDEAHPQWRMVLSYAQMLDMDNPLFQNSVVEPDLSIDDFPVPEDNSDDLSLDDLDVPVDDSFLVKPETIDESVAPADDELMTIMGELDEVLDELEGSTVSELVESGEGAVDRATNWDFAATSSHVDQSNTDYDELVGELDVVSESALPADSAADELESALREDFSEIGKAYEETILQEAELESELQPDPEVVVEHDSKTMVESEGTDEGDADIDDEDSVFLLDDGVGSKLDLARAYIEMEDNRRATTLLNDVMSKGTEQQQKDAQELMSKIKR
jgi:pilus assembly protein FimV